MLLLLLDQKTNIAIEGCSGPLQHRIFWLPVLKLVHSNKCLKIKPDRTGLKTFRMSIGGFKPGRYFLHGQEMNVVLFIQITIRK